VRVQDIAKKVVWAQRSPRHAPGRLYFWSAYSVRQTDSQGLVVSLGACRFAQKNSRINREINMTSHYVPKVHAEIRYPNFNVVLGF
jgi:hypothetical protein